MSSLPPPLEALDTQAFRRRLAGLIDPQDQLGLDAQETQRLLAIEFIATLPHLFGDELDRTTLWDRIGSAIETSYAKTVGGNHEFFINQVCEHIKADKGAAARNDRLASVLQALGNASTEERQAWMLYLHDQVVPVLVYARAEWEAHKASNGKKGGR